MIVVIIQARMGATRLPDKVLKEVCGKTLLEHLFLRLAMCKTIDNVIVATTDSPNDDAVAELTTSLGRLVYRGSEQDVLDRYYQAAKKCGADTIVRITADCPLMDSRIVDMVVERFVRGKGKHHYVSNINPPTYPDGMDVEVFSFTALERAWREGKLPSEREHVTPYIRNHPEFFSTTNVAHPVDLSAFRLTVDEPRDLELITQILNSLYPTNPTFSMEDTMQLLHARPELLSINSDIKRNEGMKKSLGEDKKFGKA